MPRWPCHRPVDENCRRQTSRPPFVLNVRNYDLFCVNHHRRRLRCSTQCAYSINRNESAIAKFLEQR
ncbi:unnamed protein product, partial [Iphiclides podalirius]